MSDIFDTESESEQSLPAEIPEASSSIALTGGNYGQLKQVAELMSKSTIIPAVYQNKPENCFIALEYAQRFGINAMMVMQNLDVIQGKPNWSSKFLIAIANECGRYSKIRYEWVGTEGQDDWGCRAHMTELSTGEKLVGPRVTIEMAKGEGWHGKNGSKWKTMPEVMLQYRAAAFLIRTHAPELTMGLYSRDEREDMINVTPDRAESAAERAWRESQVKEVEVMD
ncbi:hypothetical protein [Sporomusa sphaeroides]|uniref:RecT family protein n=1 Tax=Sporomusa sphaeroides DSM 2875 TaxID=1337886 RepID=A0ABP2C405_9FIRM|nr:hypothetical protein [Sporomusa sphaeroides]OLS56402.1 hypothetical protein SPSPH_27950 [Sporomusa sphaeroides DSM 2875]CVK18497.1 hypothetical protein SSPH_01135 [Sporomusa sphaeroides DSM 2875]